MTIEFLHPTSSRATSVVYVINSSHVRTAASTFCSELNLVGCEGWAGGRLGTPRDGGS
jgi:hypothetical protein